MDITIHSNASSFLGVARESLEAQESASGLLLGIALHLAESPAVSKPEPYLATVTDDSGVVIAAVMTPPNNIVLFGSRPDELAAALRLLCEHLFASRLPVPGVLAPVPVASGWQFCCLHADRANAAANRVYRKVGFRPVCDFQEYRFEELPNHRMEHGH